MEAVVLEASLLLQEPSPTVPRPTPRSPRAVGDVAAYNGRILQRRWHVSPLLHGNAGPSRSGAGGSRCSGALEGLQETGLARVAIALDAFGHGRPTYLHHPG